MTASGLCLPKDADGWVNNDKESSNLDGHERDRGEREGSGMNQRCHQGRTGEGHKHVSQKLQYPLHFRRTRPVL